MYCFNNSSITLLPVSFSSMVNCLNLGVMVLLSIRSRKDKIVNLTEQGVKKVENFFHIENLADPENLEIQHNMILALRAH